MKYKPFYKVGDIVKILPFINSDMKDYACVRYVPGDIATIQEIIQEKEHESHLNLLEIDSQGQVSNIEFLQA